MSNDYLVMIEAVDCVNVEAEDTDSAGREAVEAFKTNPGSAAFNVTVMRETKDGEDNFPSTSEGN